MVLNISSSDFYRLTPVQLSIAFELKKQIKDNDLYFQQYQTRLINYYQIVSYNGSKEFKKPTDLYTIGNETKFKQLTEEQKTYLLNEITDEEQEIIYKLSGE